MNIKTSEKYVELPKIMKIGKELCKKYPAQFSDIPFEGIRCYANLESKDPKKGGKKATQPWGVSFLPLPLIDLLDIHAVIFIEFDYYSSLNDAQVSLLCADIFMSFAFEKSLFLKPFDVKDHFEMLNNFGFNYLENPDSPDILKTNWNWR